LSDFESDHQLSGTLLFLFLVILFVPFLIVPWLLSLQRPQEFGSFFFAAVLAVCDDLLRLL
jgi:hypothetical protein